MGLAHCKGQAITLWVITSGATHLAHNAIIACGGKGADMGVSHATKRDNSIHSLHLW